MDFCSSNELVYLEGVFLLYFLIRASVIKKVKIPNLWLIKNVL